MTANLHPALMMPHVFTEETKHIQKELQSIVKQKTHAPIRLGYCHAQFSFFPFLGHREVRWQCA